MKMIILDFFCYLDDDFGAHYFYGIAQQFGNLSKCASGTNPKGVL